MTYGSGPYEVTLVEVGSELLESVTKSCWGGTRVFLALCQLGLFWWVELVVFIRLPKAGYYKAHVRYRRSALSILDLQPLVQEYRHSSCQRLKVT